jgi:hypothetical protein
MEIGTGSGLPNDNMHALAAPRAGLAQAIELHDIQPAGDLRERAERNFRRLHDEPFRADAVLHASTFDVAPGDWPGRAILALTLLAQALDQEPLYLAEIVARLPEAYNAEGYLGRVHPHGEADESALAGHNALLRGLTEYILWQGDQQAGAAVARMVNSLVTPRGDLFASYPAEALARLKGGGLIGQAMTSAGAWRGLNSDIGQAFMILDGATQAYHLAPSPALAATITAIISRFAAIDSRAIGAQTHGMLTGLRGTLRWYEEVDPRPEYLDLVRRRFALYLKHATTEHHANFNWFDRPEWTEACAVVDAFTLCLSLWRLTGEISYLEEAHHIYYNALLHAQRPNGGFGCDTCVGGDGSPFLAPEAEGFEAPWCCTMRGAEGLARAIQAGYYTRQDAVILPFFGDSVATLRLATGTLTLQQRSSYPYDGIVELEVLDANLAARPRLELFVPSWVRRSSLRFQLNDRSLPYDVDGVFALLPLPSVPGERLVARFDLELRWELAHNADRMPGYRRLYHGPLLLGSASATGTSPGGTAHLMPLGRGAYRDGATGAVLAPLGNLTYLTEDAARASRLQVLFPDHAAE